MRGRTAFQGRLARLLLLAGALGLAACTTLPLHDEWTEVRSEHFTVTSDAAPERAEALARSLELFRAAVVRLTSVTAPEASVPTRIFYFRSEAGYAAFRPDRHVAGFFRPTPTANFVVLGDGAQAEPVVRHEYAHYLMHGTTGRIYPAWYEEGYAEYLSTVEREGDLLVLGRASEGRLATLRRRSWLPMARVLRHDRSESLAPADRARFYAQAWLLVHYLNRDGERRAHFGDRFLGYARRVEEGAAPAAAFEAAFQTPLEALEQSLHGYMDTMVALGIPIETLEAPRPTEVRPLARAEAAARLGELALAGNDAETARELFAAALRTAPDHAAAHAGMAGALARSGDLDAAEAALARALEREPEAPAHHLRAGQLWIARARASQDRERQAECLARARRHLATSHRRDASQPAVYLAYGTTFLFPGEEVEEGLPALERAMRLLPSNVEAGLTLARAYAAAGRPAAARQLLRRIAAWRHDETLTAEVERLLAWIDRDPMKEASPGTP